MADRARPSCAPAYEDPLVVEVDPAMEQPLAVESLKEGSKKKKRHAHTALRQIKGLNKHRATIKRLNAVFDADGSALDRTSSSFIMPETACGSTAMLPRFFYASAQMLLGWFDDPDVEREYRCVAMRPRPASSAVPLHGADVRRPGADTLPLRRT